MNIIKWTSMTKAFIVILGITGISSFLSNGSFNSWLLLSLILLAFYAIISAVFTLFFERARKQSQQRKFEEPESSGKENPSSPNPSSHNTDESN